MRFSVNFDLFSFWIGFLTATLFGFVVLRLRHLLPKLKEINRKRQEEREKLYHQSTVFAIRKNTLRRCQSSHLFAAYFPLNSILVNPCLYAKPLPLDPDGPAIHEPMIDRLLPYLPEWPELTAELPIHKISLEKALSRGKNIVVTGDPGTGKTVCLAQLASSIAENKSQPFSAFLPVFLHYRELDFSLEDEHPLNGLILALLMNLKSVNRESLDHVILDHADAGRLILFMDGFEEISANRIAQVERWLSSLMKHYPKVRIVTTSSSTFTGKLINLGFSAMPIASWSKTERDQHIQLWTKEWTKVTSSPIDAQILALLTNMVTRPLSPLEQTQLLWSALSANSFESANSDSSLIKLCTQMVPLSVETYTRIAENIVANDFAGISASDLGLILSADPMFVFKEETTSDTLANKDLATSKSVTHRTPDTVIADLLRFGIFQKLDQSIYNFCHSSQLISFFALSSSVNPPPGWRSLLRSSVEEQLAFNLFKSGKLNQPVTTWLAEDDAPLYRNLHLLSKWVIRSGSTESSLSNLLYKRIIQLLQNNQLPQNLRLRLAAPFFFSKETSSFQIIKLFSTHHDESLRLISAFGLGYLPNPEAVEILRRLCQDRDKLVQRFACISLSKIWTPAAQKILVDLILGADEDTRQLIAELFAFIRPEGRDLLKELSALEDNVVARRASVFGLQLVHEDWSIELLKGLSVNDSQWVVRNAAAQALESPDPDPLYVPVKPSQPSECPWLIKYASSLGIGLPAGDYPYDLLMKILSDKTNEYRIQALEYITLKPEIKTVKTLSTYMGTEHLDIRDAVYDSFLQFSQRGLIN